MFIEERRRLSQMESLSIELISGLLMLIGLGAIGFLFVSINRDASIMAATQSEAGGGAVILAFLNNIGIIVPALLIALGIYFFRLGTQLRSRSVSPANWSRLTLFWLTALAIVMFVQTTISAVTESWLFGTWLGAMIPLLIGGFAFGVSYVWMGRNMGLFEGSETLTSRSSRLAWNLLIPTVAVLIIVAARPLERTFIASLTNQQFAGSAETEFVGLDNYGQLLGVRLDSIPCETGENGECLLEENRDGEMEVVYPSPRDYLGEEYRDLRFRTVNEFDFLGQHLIFSARDRDFLSSIGNTLTFSVASVVIELVLGLFIAMVVNSKFRGRGIMRAAMLVPWAIPTVVSARLWEVMLRDSRSGVINDILIRLGVIDSAQAWLANPDLQLGSMVAIDVWKTTPFMALILLAGLQVIPTEIYEAADVDGASKVRQFISLTLPMLRPTIAVALVFRTLDAVRVFDVFNVLLGRQKLSMATYNYEMLVNNQDLGYASAVGVAIFVIILVFTVLYVQTLGVSAE